MFRRKITKQVADDKLGLAARLWALGVLLERRGYSLSGLCIVEVDGGFIVQGHKVPDRGMAFRLVLQGQTFSTAEVSAELDQVS